MSTFGDEYFHYLDCADGFKGAHICKKFKLHTLNICSSLYVNYIMAQQRIFFFFLSNSSQSQQGSPQWAIILGFPSSSIPLNSYFKPF